MSLKVLDSEWVQGEHLLYKDCGKLNRGSKTHKYEVFNITNRLLIGYIKWYVPWKQYVFYSLNFMFQHSDLQELSEVCKSLTSKYKEENFGVRPKSYKRHRFKQGKLKFPVQQQNVDFITENM